MSGFRGLIKQNHICTSVDVYQEHIYLLFVSSVFNMYMPAVSYYQKKAGDKISHSQIWLVYDMHHQIFDICTCLEIKMISYSDKKPTEVISII